MDRSDLAEPAMLEVSSALDALIGELDARGVRVSGWYGNLEPLTELAGWERANRGLGYEPLAGAADDERFPWFLYWEIGWLVVNNDLRPGQRLLDLGGSSSLFSCYVASLGLEVVTVELDERLVLGGDRIAQATGWNLRNLRMDMRELHEHELGGRFDHVTSVCVLEHLPVSGRIAVSRQIPSLLHDGGSFSVTFDYANPSLRARIGSPDDVDEQFRVPGLAVRDNQRFHDNGRRYLLHPFNHPEADREGWRELAVDEEQFPPGQESRPGPAADYTFGAFFQRRGGPE